MEKYKKEVNDEMAITNLRKCDSICLKITIALIVCIGFLAAILRFSISSEIIGYLLMGVLVCISIIRVVVFCIIDKNGIYNKNKRISWKSWNETGWISRVCKCKKGKIIYERQANITW